MCRPGQDLRPWPGGSSRIVAADFTEASGQLRPTDKVRRNVVIQDYAADIDALYSRAG